MANIYGRERISKISTQLKLPYWWVESVIVEYFPCRRYAESEELWAFDFNKLTDEDVKKIPEKKIIVSELLLVQNVQQRDIAQRIALRSMGLPCIPLDESNLIPEGFVNSTRFPFPAQNDISAWDKKLEFSQRAVVLDNDIFYQWTIAMPYNVENEHRIWYKSDLFDLDKLYSINRTLREYRNSDCIKKPTSEFIKQIKNKYDELENERELIRDKIWRYHLEKKPETKPSDANMLDPPMLSCFDAVKLTEHGYRTKTHMEPLFLRSAIRNLHRAKEAKSKREADPNDHDALLDEIEYSAMCIINSVNCLETYINFIISKYLSEASRVFDGASGPRQKWLWVPDALNLPQRFKPSDPPFSDFSESVKWRNNTIHHTPAYTRVRGASSHVANQLNLKNATRAVKAVKEMVILLSSGGKIPVPAWIRTDMGSAEYWNEVKDYLEKI